MKSSHKQVDPRRSIPFRLASYTCALLGILWAISPLIHGVFHVAQVPHHHPVDSVHQRDHADHLGTHRHSHAHHDHTTHGDHSHGDHSHEHTGHQETWSDVDASDDQKESKGGHGESRSEKSNRPSKDPEPTGDSGVFFLVLDVASTSSIAIDVSPSESSPPLESLVSEESECFSATLIGASGPRGPPA